MPSGKSALRELRYQEREARRSIIIDAAISLFATKPFNQVSIRDIAAQAGISPASIYRYFEDQDQLFVEALFREANAITANLLQRIERSERVGLKEIAVNFVEYLLDHETFFRMMTHFMVDGGISQQALERFNETQRRLLDIFEGRFRGLGMQGNPRLLAHAFFSALNGVLITFCNYPGRSPAKIRQHMTRLATLLAHIFEEGKARETLPGGGPFGGVGSGEVGT